MITFLILAIYTVSGIILFATRDKLKKLTLVEYLFIPAQIIFFVTVALYALLVYIVGTFYRYLSALFKR